MDGCGSDLLSYIDNISKKYPVMRHWYEHTDMAIVSMTRIGNLDALKAMHCLCDCISPEQWQTIADTAARYGYLHIIEWVQSMYDIDWQSTAFIARDAGYPEIASYADGYEYVIEDDDFPLNLSGPTGDPMEDKAKYIFDYRMQDWKEEFLPEESLVIASDDEDDGYAPFDDGSDLIHSEFEDDENPYASDVIPL